MSAKTLLPNQCTPLHWIYGHEDCCLCEARRQIDELKQKIAELIEKTEKDNKQALK